MAKPLLHLVFGGEVKDSRGMEFTDAETCPQLLFCETAIGGPSHELLQKPDVGHLFLGG